MVCEKFFLTRRVKNPPRVGGPKKFTMQETGNCEVIGLNPYRTLSCYKKEAKFRKTSKNVPMKIKKIQTFQLNKKNMLSQRKINHQ